MEEMRGIPEADAFVRRNIRFVPLSHINGHYAPLLRCIDGRRGVNPDRLGGQPGEPQEGSISFPGGGIGLAALVLSAINIPFIEPWKQAKDARAESAQKCFSFDRVIDCIERSMGGMSGHTSDHAIDEPLACAGCGHVTALLNGGYGLGETYRAQMTEYLKKLKARALAGDKDVVIDVYHGEHAETAALRLKCTLSFGEFLSIPPTDGEMSVFVFSELMALEVLARIAGLLYEEMRSDFKDHGISKDEFLAQARSLYFSHVRSSAHKLAHNFPVYDVVHREPGVIEVRKSDLRY